MNNELCSECLQPMGNSFHTNKRGLPTHIHCEPEYIREQEKKKIRIERNKINEDNNFNSAIRRVKEVSNQAFWSSCHADCFRFSLNETDKHARKKFELFYEYRRIGCIVFTELILNDNSRPDLIVCFPDGLIQIIEVIESEGEESLKDKEQRYPFQIVRVRA